MRTMIMKRSEGYYGKLQVSRHLRDPKLLRAIAGLVLLAAAIMYFHPHSPPDVAVEHELVEDPFSPLPLTMIKKISLPRRRLLSAARSRKEALEGLEDAFLEQPGAEERKVKRINYLPDLMGDDWLVGFPRRVFVDVGSKKEARSSDWFGRGYPKKKGAEFEIVRVELSAEKEDGGGIGDWLEKNVRAEEFVVVKADADAVEEMVRENVIDLVDELFLECDDARGKRRRAYWECLALYGRVRDRGVAVHQLWE